MGSISSLETVVPHPLKSLPSSPTEQDLTLAHDDDDDEYDNHNSNSLNKGKGKLVQDEYTDHSSEEALNQGEAGREAYPPVSNDEVETHRIEETLRRWEVAERQRRKAARESTASAPAPSFIERASFLWPSKKSKHHSHPSNDRTGLGNHTALKSRESVDVVPLDEIAASPTPSPARSPSGEGHSQDPFENPASPFDDSNQSTAMMSPSLNPLPSSSGLDQEQTPLSTRPVLLATSSSFSRPPPPKPINLPPPRTPPPPISSPPAPLTPPVISATSPPPEAKTRWWHEWLCGCGEGADRGGDNQAGRTNPFE